MEIPVYRDRVFAYMSIRLPMLAQRFKAGRPRVRPDDRTQIGKTERRGREDPLSADHRNAVGEKQVDAIEGTGGREELRRRLILQKQRPGGSGIGRVNGLPIVSLTGALDQADGLH